MKCPFLSGSVGVAACVLGLCLPWFSWSALSASPSVPPPKVSKSSSEPDSLFPWPDLSQPPQILGETGGEHAPSDAPENLGKSDAALVVGIADYAFAPDVLGADDNADAWWSFLRKNRGIHRERAILLRNQEATREGILEAVHKVASMVEAGGTAWFIFIGHGVATADGEDGMAVGMDAQRTVKSLDARSVSLKKIESILEKSQAQQVVLLVDSCFSGLTTSGETLVPGLQPLLRPQAMSATSISKTIRMTAGHRDQFAGQLPHGDKPAFSYLVLGALRGWGDSNGDGVVTAREAVDYAAMVLNLSEKGRRQTPELLAHSSNENFPLSVGEKEVGPDLDALVLFQSKGGDVAHQQGATPSAPHKSVETQTLASPKSAETPKKTEPIQVVQFVDYADTNNKKRLGEIRAIFQKFNASEVHLIIRHVPSRRYKSAQAAAEAALCANDQGAFQQMHEALLQTSRFRLSTRKFNALAKEMNLDLVAFQGCLRSKKYAQAVTKDRQDAQKLGVQKTPAFTVDGKLVGLDRLERTLDEALHKSATSPAR